MAQWQELLKLDSALQGQVRQLYEGKFSREIRHYLCLPIESLDWDLAAEDENKARTCLQALLVFLEEQWNRTVQQNSILQGPDFPAMKDYLLKNFENFPLNLASILSECLKEEKKILASAPEAQGCGSPTMEQKRRMLDNRINDLKRQTAEVKQETKSLEGLYEKLDFIEKNWRSRVEEHPGFPQPQAVVEKECLQQANFITRTYQMVQQQIAKILKQTEPIVMTLSDVELPEWKHRQQMACIGSPVDTSLDYLEKWFMAIAEVLLQICKQVQKLQDLIKKYNRTNFSNLSGPMAEIEAAALLLLKRLLSNALVVEQQPVMTSQPQRPLIIKTKVCFTVKVRFLANLTEFIQKCLLKVTPVFDKDVAEAKTIKGYRQFDFSSDYKVMDVYTAGGGLEAEFGHMLLKEKKGNSKGAQENNGLDKPAGKRKRNQSDDDQNHLTVTEELHVIKFVMKFQYAGLDLNIETSSLPLVVISSTNQVPAAWASIMWFNVLSNSDVKDLSLFLKPPPLTWEQLSQVLSWQFLAVGELGLNRDQLCALRDKFVYGPDGLFHWKDFSKIESSAWFWIDGILDLIRKHLVDLWRDGSIVGFVSRARTEALLKEKQTGTFLIRFSESNRDGAITFSWVEHSVNETHVHAVDPYTKKELSVNSLPDIIYNYSMINTNSKPLLYLYPDIPKDTAFGRYYQHPEKAAPKNCKNGYVAKKFIPVSNNPTPPPSPTRELEMMDTDSVNDTKVALTLHRHSLSPTVPQSITSSTMEHKEVIQELFPDIFCDSPRLSDLYTPNQDMLSVQNNFVYP